MTWLRKNLRVIVTVLIFTATALAGVRAELRCEIAKKADREPIVRELDQIQDKLDRIQDRLDKLQ